MGLARFQQALFAPPEGNGTGYYVQDQTSQLPAWQPVTNHVAYATDGLSLLRPYTGPTMHKLSFPGDWLMYRRPGCGIAG